MLRLRLATPTTLVDLNKISELRGVRDDGDTIEIGAMTTHHDVINDPLVGENATLLALATQTVGDPQIRHRGTLGGALVHGDPAGDLLAPAVALDCAMVIVGPGGRRTVPATVRTEGESIAQARVALTNMGTTPVRAVAVEQAHTGQPATAETIRATAEHTTEGTHPISDGTLMPTTASTWPGCSPGGPSLRLPGVRGV